MFSDDSSKTRRSFSVNGGHWVRLRGVKYFIKGNEWLYMHGRVPYIYDFCCIQFEIDIDIMIFMIPSTVSYFGTLCISKDQHILYTWQNESRRGDWRAHVQTWLCSRMPVHRWTVFENYRFKVWENNRHVAQCRTSSGSIGSARHVTPRNLEPVFLENCRSVKVCVRVPCT